MMPAGSRIDPLDERFVAPEFRGRRLRIGLLLDSTTLPAWVSEILQQILAKNFAEIVCVVVNGAESGDAKVPVSFASRLHRWIKKPHAHLFAAYMRLDSRRYPLSRDAWQPTDLADVVQGVHEQFTVLPRMTKYCDYFSDDDAARIEAQSVDVLVRFGFRILKGKVLTSARFGVWSFHHGNNAINRGGPAAFWEVWHGQPSTGAVLQRLSEDLDAGQVLARCYARTETLSFGRNRANLYWQAAQLLPRTLLQLYEEGPRALNLDGIPETWEAYSQRLYVAPMPRETIALFGRLLVRLVGRKARTLREREQWFVAYRFVRGVPESNEVPDASPHRFKELIPPADRFWADPFPVAHEGRHYLFIEEFLRADPHAHICVVAFDEHGTPGEPRVVLKRPYHLSYPNVFRWNGSWYMLPETAKQRRVELFRASEFPHSWAFDAVLLDDITAVDPTIVEIDGRWWLMCATAVEGTTEANALRLFYADSPLGPWLPHRRNPVKMDVHSARPAGRPFRHGGRLYRPAQDGAPNYGSAIVVHEILELTPSTFREVEVARIRPEWRPGLTGTHTLNAAGSLTAIDARQRRGRF